MVISVHSTKKKTILIVDVGEREREREREREKEREREIFINFIIMLL